MKRITKTIGIFLSIAMIILSATSSSYVYADSTPLSIDGTCAEIAAAAGYFTLESAITAFAKTVYGYSEYARIEYGAVLYKYGSRYYYASVQAGSPHNISIVAYLPAGATFKGYIHTHTMFEDFSEEDITSIVRSNCAGYLVTKSYKVLRFDPSTAATTVYLNSFVPNSLTDSQKSELVESFGDIWYGHFENGNCERGFVCRNLQWPQDSSTQHGNNTYTWTENHYHSDDMHYYEYGFKCTHCNVFAFTEWTSGPCRGGDYCITPWSLRDEPIAA